MSTPITLTGIAFLAGARLAFALASRSPWIVADEFTATLDRPLAKVVAFNLRKLVSRTGTGVLAATTHDDVVEDLNPDLWVHCLGEGHIEVERRDVKKKTCRSRTSFGSRKAPEPTGRTSLGGITAATTSPIPAR